MPTERDYVLGTHEEELARLGLQHDVWRPVVLDCWRRAGIIPGSRVLDVGAGPGYATVDLAGIVGPAGAITAVERSSNFVSAAKEACRVGGLTNVSVHELDLMTDPLPGGPYDFAWSRWVAAFVSHPALLIEKIAGVLRPGGTAIFHEYAGYETWRFTPRRPSLEKFREYVIATWRESGGEPDAGLGLAAPLTENNFVIRTATPHVFCLRPNDDMWRWPAVFVEVYLARLRESGRIDDPFIAAVRQDLAEAEKSPNSLMITPLVLEIIADKK